MQGNLVGIKSVEQVLKQGGEKMTKSIYIIKNDINNKVYIGQASDVKKRYQAHCKPSSASVDNDLVAKAIQKYGKIHFWYEILESNIENYNEQEQYWIKCYNSIRPNGYNILPGGETPPMLSGAEHPNSKLNQFDIQGIIYDLQYSDLSYRQLSKKYNIAFSTIGSINSGKSYKQDNVLYPIRKQPNGYGKLSKEQALEIVLTLKYTYLSYEEIAKKYQVEARAISRINKGLYHRFDDEEYPIRDYANTKNRPKLTYEQVTEIINLLINTDMSINKISKRYQVESNIIIGIKSGHTKIYRRKELTYPLRKNN